MSGHLLDESARGVFIIAATPFADSGTLDTDSLARLIEFYLGAGVHGLTILGMMGEAPKLTFEESCLVVEHTLRRVAGAVPVVVGVSNPGLANVAQLTGVAMAAGAAGVMIAPPAGLATDEQIEGYLHQACDTLGRHPWARRAGGPAGLPAGDRGAAVGSACSTGCSTTCRRSRCSSTRTEAFDLYDAYLPLIRYEQQPGVRLAIRMEILHRRGVLASPKVRPPGARLDAHDRAELEGLLARLRRRIDRGV